MLQVERGPYFSTDTTTPDFSLVHEWAQSLVQHGKHDTAGPSHTQALQLAVLLLDSSETHQDTPTLFFPPVGHIKSNYAQSLNTNTLLKTT